MTREFIFTRSTLVKFYFYVIIHKLCNNINYTKLIKYDELNLNILIKKFKFKFKLIDNSVVFI